MTAKKHYVGFDPEKIDGSHRFLAEALLSPWVPHTDLSRLQMFNSHVSQAVVLNAPETPRVFTGFERQIGMYSHSFKAAWTDLTLRHKIKKNQFTTTYVLIDDKTAEVDVVEISSCAPAAENFGYSIVDELAGLGEGDSVEEGQRLFRSHSYDDDHNFAYGINLKAVFLAFRGQTYEDAVIISESAAAKLTCTMVHEVKVTVNTNDVLVNVYGDSVKYRSFPGIGEPVANNVLCARRRIDYQSFLYDFNSENMTDVNPDTDDVFYSEGRVVDVEVFSNTKIEDLERHQYNSQVVSMIQNNLRYYEEIKKALEDLRANGHKLRPDACYALKHARDMVSPEIKFCDEGHSDFDNIILKFRIEREEPLGHGCKLTGRYGNKGVVSEILPDEMMPVADDGTRAEVVLNSLGVINRVNPSQLFELEFNFVADEVAKRMATRDNLSDKMALYRDLIGIVSKSQLAGFDEMVKGKSDEDITELLTEMEENGIALHVPPFHGCPDFDVLRELFHKYDISPPNFHVKHSERDMKIGNPLMIGEMYFLRLKHDSMSKFSARSGGYLSLSGIPSKNNRQFKESKAPYSKTAVRLGEMELVNMFVLKDIDELFRFLSLYSSNGEDRRTLALRLLGVRSEADDEVDPLRLKKVELSGADSLPKTILDAYLKAMGMELKRD